jgi:hypothetical protein
MRPFGDGDTFATFKEYQDNLFSEIDQLENDYVLKVSVSELEEPLAVQRARIIRVRKDPCPWARPRCPLPRH